jgi:hypothetical protein
LKTGELNRIIGISTKSETITSGDITEVWGTAASVRAKITQIDGTRFMTEAELVDRAVYKIELWDNAYSDNIKITYGSIVLFPIRPITRNPGRSFVNEIVIYAATKK